MLAAIKGMRDGQRQLGLSMEHGGSKLASLFKKFDVEGMPSERA